MAPPLAVLRVGGRILRSPAMCAMEGCLDTTHTQPMWAVHPLLACLLVCWVVHTGSAVSSVHARVCNHRVPLPPQLNLSSPYAVSPLSRPNAPISLFSASALLWPVASRIVAAFHVLCWVKYIVIDCRETRD